MKNRPNPFLRSAALAVVSLALGQAASATDYYWNTTATGSWATGANWSDADSGGTTGVVPGTLDSVFFNQSSVNGAEIITLDADQLITGITFNNTGTTAFRANASGTTARKITLGTGGITIASTAGNVTFSQTPATYGVLTIDTAATTQVWTNNATLLTTGPVTGSGQLTLTGANSSSANVLGQFSLDLSAYTGNLILNNSRLVNQVATNGFGTTGTITVNNGAQLYVNVANTTVSRAVSIAGNGWYDSGAIQRGAIRFTTTGTFSNTVTLAADSRILASNTGTFSGKVTGNFGLEIGRTGSGAEAGNVEFSGGTANDYTGLTTISSGGLLLNKTAGVNAIAGNVLVSNVGTLSNSANNQIADSATVGIDSKDAKWTLNGKSETVGTVNVSGVYAANFGLVTGVAGKLNVTNLNISGGGVTFNSAGAGLDSTITANTITNTGGTWVFGTASGTQSLVVGSGGLTIGGGSTMNVASAATATTFISLGGNVTSQANANTNTISTSGTNAGQLRLNATRTFDVADGAAASDLTISAVVANGTGTGGIIKTGAGLMTLGRANTFTGGLTIKEGTLLSTASTAITTASSLTLGDSTGVSTTAATFDMTTADVNYGNPINVVGTNQVNTIKDSSFTLALSGAITLTNANLTLNQATSANMNVSGGVTGTGNLLISGSGTGGSLNLITAALNHTGTITNNGSGTSATNISSVIGTNVTGVTQNSATSTLTLSGPNTYTGTTTISAGILNAGVADGVGTGALGNGGNITFSGGRLQYSAASAGTDYSARIKNSSGAVAIDTNGQNVTFTGVIDSSNTLGFTKSGTGTLTLAGASANTYTGVTAVTGGILAIANQNALNGTSGLTVGTANNSTTSLRIDVPDATSTTIGLGKSVTIRGLGSSNYGALLGKDSTSVTWAGGVVLGDTTGARIGGGDSGTLTVDGVISETSAGSAVLFSRAPNSTTILNKVNTYTGDTGMYANGSTVTLKMGIANAISSSSRVWASTGTATGTEYFDLNGFNQNIRALLDDQAADLVVTNSSLANDAELKLSTSGSNSFNGWIQDGATRKVSLVVAGAGTQIFTNINTYTGGTRIDGGTLFLSHATNTLADTGAVNVNGGTLSLGNSGANSDTVGALTLTSGNITGTSGTLTGTGSNYDVRSGSISAKLGGTIGLDKSTAGTVTLSGASSYTGVTTLGAGILSVASIGNGGVAGNLGQATANAANIVFDGGTLQYTGNTATSDRAFTINAGKTATIYVSTSGQSLSLVGATGAATTGALAKSGVGTLELTGANTFTGDTTISQGTLALGSGGSIGNSSTIHIANGATFDVSAVSTFTVGSLQTLAGAGTVKGNTTVNGTLGIGSSPGTMTFDGNLLLGGISDFEFGSALFTSGSYDLAQSTVGSVAFGGILNLFFDSGETYANNSSVQIFDFGGGYSGGFTTVNFSGLGAGQSATFNASTGFVTVIPEPRAALLGGLGLLMLLRRRR